MSVEHGVLLPVRIETRFKNGDLWLRVVPDEPWFVRDDPRITPTELNALQRYVASPSDPPAGVPAAWSALAAAVGAPRAAYLHRTFVSTGSDGTLVVRAPEPDETRSEPTLPRIVGFPTELGVWAADGAGLHQVLTLHVDRSLLLANFADRDVPGDKRWWEDWNAALAAGVAGIVPAASLTPPIQALFVGGLGDGHPGDLFAGLAADGRLGLLQPGLPTNSVEGAPAAPLANNAATWWEVLHGEPGAADADVSRVLTGDPARLGHLPGGDQVHRAPASALVTALWPALWGFTASQVFDIARGAQPAEWAGATLFAEGAFPIVRVGQQPYGLLPTTAWSLWQANAGDPAVEAPLVRALLILRARHARSAEARGTVAGKDTDGLLDLIADTPSSGRFRFRPAWPLELWWLAAVSSGLPIRWRDFANGWTTRHPLTEELALAPLRLYGTRGPSRAVGLPLVVPPGVNAEALTGLLGKLADAAIATPSAFADTAAIEATVLDGHGDSLLLRLAVRSIQLVIADIAREPADGFRFDPEPFARDANRPGTLQLHIRAATPGGPGLSAKAQLSQIAGALRTIGAMRVPELERRLRATIDMSTHRIDPWLTAVPQRRLDSSPTSGVPQPRLGAYGWVDGPTPGHPGPTDAGLLHTPSPSTALVAAVLRDRAVSDPSSRWDIDLTSRRARLAGKLADEVRNGAFLAEVAGRELERIVGRVDSIVKLRQGFPLRTEHAGRRVCDGLKVLGQDPFPVALDAVQAEAVADLRAALDTYGDLLVADAVHHLVEGRADAAGQVMDAAAGLSRPPELGVLRTPREGRAISTSIALAFPYVAGEPLPSAPHDLALVSPAGVIDASAAAALAAHAGAATEWDFVVAGATSETSVSLADLDLTPADALALTRSELERLAVEAAGSDGAIVGGSGAARYERAAELAGLIGRRPATRRTFSETRTADLPGDPVSPELVTRYAAALEVARALAGKLRAQVELFTGDALGTAEESKVRRLLAACAAWGVAPNPAVANGPARLVASARLALPQVDARVEHAPDASAAAQLSPSAFLEHATALISPTGQLCVMGEIPGNVIPSLAPAPSLDADYLAVVAAVRPALARLEAQQLTESRPLTPWVNRPSDPWQKNGQDTRPLIAVWADASLDFATGPATLAATELDHFDEVIPSADQRTGAAFGFDAPAARAQQAILLAVPPSATTPLDLPTLVQILVETRELAHVRMARPVDLDDEFWGLAPTGLLPATGSIATPLDIRG